MYDPFAHVFALTARVRSFAVIAPRIAATSRSIAPSVTSPSVRYGARLRSVAAALKDRAQSSNCKAHVRDRHNVAYIGYCRRRKQQR